MEEFVVTPWEVRGKIDYDKLVKNFGTKYIDESLLQKIKKLTGDLHFLLRRKIFYSHRDLDKLLNDYERGIPFYLYTGRGPSGHVHLGHLIPWILTKWLQDRFNVKLLFQITDDEKFLFKKTLSLEDALNYAYDNILDIIALGFDHRKTEIFIDTEYIKSLYKIALKVAKHLTYSTVKAAFGFDSSYNIGAIFFTAIQSAPAFIEYERNKRLINCLIPCAIDQDPHFRLTRDVAKVLKYPKPCLIHSKFFPSLSGLDKMSSSEEVSCIYVTDDEELVRKKIWKAVTGGRGTVKEQREKGGIPKNCSIFMYYYYLFEPDDNKLREIENKCKNGELLCGDCKEDLILRINKFLKEHRKKREKAKDLIDKYLVRD